jgi:hypothetical protein
MCRGNVRALLRLFFGIFETFLAAKFMKGQIQGLSASLKSF